MIDSSSLPAEVYDRLSWHLANIPDLAQVIYAAKTEQSRAAAWYSIEIDPRDERNPWRKAHTLNYWVWWRCLRPGEAEPAPEMRPAINALIQSHRTVEAGEGYLAETIKDLRDDK